MGTHLCIGLVFTSQTAVESAISALADSEADTSATSTPWAERLAEEWKDHPIFVVGKATAQAGMTSVLIKDQPFCPL